MDIPNSKTSTKTINCYSLDIKNKAIEVGSMTLTYFMKISTTLSFIVHFDTPWFQDNEEYQNAQ